MEYRIEQDLVGKREIPDDAYWGIHTLRAQENFRISTAYVRQELIHAIAIVKKACCETNSELGCLDKTIADAICGACDDIINESLTNQFPLDALQGGAGTSTNMNVNEVIANRALERMGNKKGEYAVVHPIAHVNMHQSTNDVYPTAIKIAAINGFRILSKAAEVLQGAFQNKENEFSGIVFMGRTEMQDAVPMTLGAQFASFADAISRDRWRTFKCEERLRVVNIGGTAIGTGITVPQSYIFLVIEKLRDLTGMGLSRAENAVDATANADVFVEVAGMLAAHAASMRKIANDLRLLHMFGNISLPAVQAGSSIMPGKVNPVICEAVISASVKVCANVTMITECASAGTLQINEFLPLIGHVLLESLDILANTDTMLAKHVLDITANVDLCDLQVCSSIAIITAFVPEIGYEACEQLVQEYANVNGMSFRDFLNGKLGKESVDFALSPQRLMALGYSNDVNRK